ncbi:hypothetical protein D9K79_09245 [Acinetobacter cumulans]|jgi:sulfur transfer complex TusBCD TusB component (DsrH family)|uniref:Sulfurtransferase complex subunit TusB n=1 Tax=Acinetobacter cumulans TaxID=2136182 RepID=A0A498CW62_9GAMM|nr:MULTISPECIES: hypothetical protein [Acinetobacter]NWK75261.1 hypothetical protein [Acinetobacter sp. SwsAc6]QCO22025.1 hypothetical protein C9E88_011300 [Acinetobacter cumulans]RKG47429.1 hypothetical protein D7V68_11390 [Acinetobacter cumulans]RLL31879.1 hypothetical protein D9K80_14470 [Acinetobacter cumulans]RLL45591.1 hypothetical protein D9K79_09245 [Acinetobacter cumulans]
MNTSTLFLVQSSYANTLSVLEKLQQMATSTDRVVLMGDAVMHVAQPTLANFSCAILDTEKALIPADSALEHLAVLNYAQFATLCLQYTRVVTLK